VFVGGGNALLFIAKTYSCSEWTFDSNYFRNTSIERMTWQLLGLRPYRHVRTSTTTCRIKLLWGKNLRLHSSTKVTLAFIYLFLSHGMTSPTMPHSSQTLSAGERTIRFYQSLRQLTTKCKVFLKKMRVVQWVTEFSTFEEIPHRTQLSATLTLSNAPNPTSLILSYDLRTCLASGLFNISK
jgi:hypothetical protein